jgi:hypothetical protein
MRIGDLEEIPEDFVVPDLERGNSGALPLPLLQRCDVLLSPVSQLAQLIEIRVESRADHVAIGE